MLGSVNGFSSRSPHAIIEYTNPIQSPFDCSLRVDSALCTCSISVREWALTNQIELDVGHASLTPRETAAAVCGKDYAPALEGVSLFIGTPTYGAKMETAHSNSVEQFAWIMGLLGVDYAKSRPTKESLIQRARNRIVREFMASKATHLLFIDADIEFEPSAPLKLLETKKDCVCAVYPRKQIDWRRVYAAFRSGQPNADLFASSAVVNLTVEAQEIGAVEFDETGCFPIMDAATGFLLISRGLVERMIAAYPETEYVDEADDEQRAMHALFDCFIEVGPNGKRRFLSEDYGFSRRVQKMGEEVWLRPDITLNHHGSYCYMGNPAALVIDDGRVIPIGEAAE